LASGTAGFVGAWWIGPRIKEDLDDFQPNNILLMLVGTGILWVGWNGFNGGDPYTASPDAGAAVLTGLVAITPAAGFVAGWGALIIGIVSGSVPWVSAILTLLMTSLTMTRSLLTLESDTFLSFNMLMTP
jgi:Amt family ammonium transporter